MVVAILCLGAVLVDGPPAQAGEPGALPLGGVIGTPEVGSVAIGCAQAGDRIEITQSSHLDPSCDWTAGFDITASDVVFDCRGAVVSGVAPYKGLRGIHVKAPTDVALEHVTVRNCIVEGFLNGYHVERLGFRDLTPEDGYDVTFSDIVFENVVARDTRGVGMFVNGFVTDVTIRDAEVTRAGSSGIYLDTDSAENVITRAHVHDNGHIENGPDGQLRTIDGLDVWWWGTGREGISIDGSARNHVVDNVIERNVAAGILVYKNCGEFHESRPDRWWGRFSGSDDNVIERNVIRDEQHGVWIGSRMAENQYFMECSDPAYGEDVLVRYHEDKADRNTVRDNSFTDVRYGVRVEDDGTMVTGNTFTGSDPASLAVLVGTKLRAELLGRPVVGTVVRGNAADIEGVSHPYRWIPSQTGTVYEANTSAGAVVDWCEGAQPTINPILFVVAIEIPVPEDPVPPPPVPPVEQPPCPAVLDPGVTPAAAAVVVPAFTG